jgi:hypothetical protein
MEDVKSNAGQNLGIAALITGIITFVLAVIPCVGVIAIIPGIITIVLASVGLSQASRSNSPKGVIVAGLVIGVIAVMISFSQIFVAGRIASKADNWPSDIQKAIEEVRDDVIRDMEDSKVSIKIESSDGDTVDINIRTKGNDVRVKQLEDLEGAKPEQNDTVKKGK